MSDDLTDRVFRLEPKSVLDVPGILTPLPALPGAVDAYASDAKPDGESWLSWLSRRGVFGVRPEENGFVIEECCDHHYSAPISRDGLLELAEELRKMAEGGMPFIDAVKQGGFSGFPAKGSQPIPNEPVQVYEDSPFWNEVRHMTTPEYRIVQMALEAGLVDYVTEQGQLITDYGTINEELRNFARLVAEDCAKVAEWEPCETLTPQRIAETIRARYSKEG